MFTDAVRIASAFTYPYVGLRRRESGAVYATMGAFVLLGGEGWALTAAHIVEDVLAVEREATDAAQPTPDRITDHAEIWAVPGFADSHPHLAEARVRPLADLALVRLEGIDPATVGETPILRDPAAHPIAQGMSVCRLGYPFHDVAAQWDPATPGFHLPEHAFPIPAFALDGIVARFHRLAADDGSAESVFIETSTPGLRGQSGGPLVDVAGRLCGIQSHTSHLDLGFDARYTNGAETINERQFLNVGAASHVSELITLLGEAGVSYRLG